MIIQIIGCKQSSHLMVSKRGGRNIMKTKIKATNESRSQNKHTI